MLLSKPLAPLKAEAFARIDNGAGNIRKLFITDIAGQQMVYDQKRAEAEQIIADPAIDPALVPHIADEALLDNITLLQQADIVMQKAQQWVSLSAMIESRRVAAKMAVQAAGNPAEIAAAEQIDWSDITALAS